MKKILKITLLFTVGIAITHADIAQKGLSLDLNYNTAKPIGSAFRD